MDATSGVLDAGQGRRLYLWDSDSRPTILSNHYHVPATIHHYAVGVHSSVAPLSRVWSLIDAINSSSLPPCACIQPYSLTFPCEVPFSLPTHHQERPHPLSPPSVPRPPSNEESNFSNFAVRRFLTNVDGMARRPRVSRYYHGL